MDALEVKAEMRERMEERIAGRGVGILLTTLFFLIVDAHIYFYCKVRTMHWATLRMF